MFRAYAFLLPSINDSSFSSSAADILLTDEIGKFWCALMDCFLQVDDYSFCDLHPLPRQSLFASPSLSTAVPLYSTDLSYLGRSSRFTNLFTFFKIGFGEVALPTSRVSQSGNAARRDSYSSFSTDL